MEIFGINGLVEKFDAEGIGIGIASATYDIVGFPPIESRREQAVV